MNFNIIRVSQDHVYENDRKLYNTNNLWARQGVKRPDDYSEILKRGNTKNWVNKNLNTYNEDEHIHKITLGRDATSWMLKASETGMLTGRFFEFFNMELEKTLEKYDHLFPQNRNNSWFVRVERVSLKEGQHGKGPYTNLKHVIQSICSGGQGHECISPEDNLDEFNIYFFPWKNIKHEFRVFIYENRISAICPQNYSSINEELNELDKTGKLIGFLYNMVEFFDKNLKDKLMNIVGPNYTIDLAILEDDSYYFIEPNSFGENYAAGSSLFEWSYEYDLLHREPNEAITFKFVNE